MASGGGAGSSKMDVEEPSASSSSSNSKSQPINMIILGMAGSGKTSLVKRMQTFLHFQQTAPYVVNLDPACAEVPYITNIGKFYLNIFLVCLNLILNFDYDAFMVLQISEILSSTKR